METFGDRIRQARDALGYSQREFARRIGTTSATISNWENNAGDPANIKGSLLQSAAGLIGKSVRYLLTGKEDTRPEVPAGLRAASPDVRMVPVISFVQAGLGVAGTDPYARGAGQEMIGVDADLAQHLSRSAFALTIEGESMLEEFRPGDVVVIEPMLKPQPGDFVVARLEADDSATFKKYRSRGADSDGKPIFELVPLNPDYPTITVNANNPGRIIGTMVEHRRRRRRY